MIYNILDYKYAYSNFILNKLCSNKIIRKSFGCLLSKVIEQSSIALKNSSFNKTENIMSHNNNCTNSIRQIQLREGLSAENLERIKLWRKQFSNTRDDIQKLNENIDLESLKKIESVLQFKSNQQDDVKCLLMKMIETRKLCRKLFPSQEFVFVTHACNVKFTAIFKLIKNLEKIFNPSQNTSVYKHFRIQKQEYISAKNYQDYFKNTARKDIPLRFDHEPQPREELLSSDGYLFNEIEDESAIDFLVRNKSILDNDGMHNVLLEIFHKYLPNIGNENEITKLVDHFIKIVISKYYENTGALFLICIPKKLINNSETNPIYRSHPYGLICDCHPPEKNLEILDKFQKDCIDKEIVCKKNHYAYSRVRTGNNNNIIENSIPQYRIVLNAIKPETGTLIFQFSPISRERKSNIKKIIHKFSEKVLSLSSNK